LVYGVIVENPCPVFRIASIDIKFLLPFLLVFIDLYPHHHPAALTNAYLLLLMSKKGYKQSAL